ncbi:hypothetical protein C6W84_16903 (plasmid) [Acinetobacter baumannii]|nr:hypothetical protein C6W84_16903 [Acinetobacter baumannii]
MKAKYLFIGFALITMISPFILPDYQVTLLNYIGLNALVVLGLVLLTGVGGMTSFGQAALVGIGAYTTAYITATEQLPSWLAWTHGSPWAALILGVIITIISAIIVGA